MVQHNQLACWFLRWLLTGNERNKRKRKHVKIRFPESTPQATLQVCHRSPVCADSIKLSIYLFIYLHTYYLFSQFLFCLSQLYGRLATPERDYDGYKYPICVKSFALLSLFCNACIHQSLLSCKQEFFFGRKADSFISFDPAIIEYCTVLIFSVSLDSVLVAFG